MQDTTKPKKEPGGPRNKPCNQCRARKVKCVYDDGSLICTRCAQQHIQCVFPHIASSNNSLQDGKRVADGKMPQPAGKKRALSQQSVLVANDGTAVSSRSESRGIPDEDHFSERDSSVPVESLLNRTLGLAKGFHARHVGATSSFPFFKAPPKHKIRNVNEHDSFMMVADASTSGYQSEIESLHAIEACVAPHGKSLVNLYFRIVHPSFPILHKKVFYEKYARSYTEFSPSLLAIVYILALQWWEYSRDLPHKGQKPDEQRLKTLAQEGFYNVLNRPKLSTVQAGLLLAQGRERNNWPHLAQVLAVAHELGLHLDCSDWNIRGWERGLRKRLAWATFMQDKWGAISNGRPSYIHDADWMVQPVTEADFPEGAEDEDEEEGSTEVEKGRELFMHMISLTLILNNVINDFCTLTAYQGMRTQAAAKIGDVLGKAKSIQAKLRSWYAQLPESLNIRNVQARKLSSVGYLHLAYCAVHITLHRAILHIATDLHTADNATDADHDLFSISYHAASATFASAAALVSNLRPEHLQSFWYFSSSYGLALIGTLGCELWAVAPADQQALWKERLSEYRWTLRVSAKGADFMEAAVEELNEMVQALEESTSEPDQSVDEHAANENTVEHALEEDVPFEFSSFDFSMIDSAQPQNFPPYLDSVEAGYPWLHR